MGRSALILLARQAAPPISQYQQRPVRRMPRFRVALSHLVDVLQDEFPRPSSHLPKRGYIQRTAERCPYLHLKGLRPHKAAEAYPARGVANLIPASLGSPKRPRSDVLTPDRKTVV